MAPPPPPAIAPIAAPFFPPAILPIRAPVAAQPPIARIVLVVLLMPLLGSRTGNVDRLGASFSTSSDEVLTAGRLATRDLAEAERLTVAGADEGFERGAVTIAGAAV